MNIYTLKNPLSGDKAILNGKLFKVKSNSKVHDDYYKRAGFIDITNNECIWLTTKVVHVEKLQNGITIITESGSIYDLINVYSLIPTSECIKDEKVVPEKIPFKVIDEKTSVKHIHYGDGYRMIDFTFDRDITREEFIDFLKENNHDTREHQEHPYQDYAVITGAGNMWKYKWVNCYTD